MKELQARSEEEQEQEMEIESWQEKEGEASIGSYLKNKAKKKQMKAGK